MKHKVLAICKSFLWCFVILIFPIVSGAVSVIFSLDTDTTLFVQGTFMTMAFIVPAILVFIGKWQWRDIGFAPFDYKECKRAFYFIPLLVLFIPAAIKGFYVKSIGYITGNLFLYLFVGLSEEVYFRGIIPRYLKKEFSIKGIILWSAFIFGIGHAATAFTGSNGCETALTVLNAFIFGWLAIEMTIISSNIIPAVLLHFLFDFETKIVVMDGNELLTAEIIRGIIMFIIAIWFAGVIDKIKNEEPKLANGFCG